jgi:hypothetical protein
MEKNKVTFGVLFGVLALVIGLGFAGCPTESDEGGGGGDGGGGDGGGGDGGKPVKLSYDASTYDVASKLDEIIDYCDDHPGIINQEISIEMKQQKNYIYVYYGTNYWEIFIDQINLKISLLE